MRSILPLALTLPALVLASCDRSAETTTTTTTVQRTEGDAGREVGGTLPPAPPPPTPVSAPPAGPRPFERLTADGIGDFTLGAKLDDVRRAIPALKVDEAMDGSVCRYINDPRREGVWAMLGAGDRIVRVDIDRRDVATDRGIRVGSTEAEVRAAYPNLTVEPHTYVENAKYLKVLGPEGTDGLVFETDANGRVERYRVGRWDEVQWVEGCS